MKKSNPACSWIRWMPTLLTLWLAGCMALPTAEPPRAQTRRGHAPQVYMTRASERVRRVAVLPFTAAEPSVGQALSDLFTAELIRTRAYSVIGRSEMAHLVGDTGNESYLSDAEAIERGRLLNADGVIVGSIIAFGHVSRGAAYLPVISMNVRLLDCNTRLELWRIAYDASAESGRINLQQHAVQTVRETVQALRAHQEHLRPKPQPQPATVQRSPSAQPTPRGAPTTSRPAPMPDRPRNLRASADGLRRVTLRWEPPLDRPAHFQIERADADDGLFTPVARINPRKGLWTDEQLSADGAGYFYRMAGVASDGRKGPYTDPVRAVTAPPPSAPERLRAAATGPREVLLEWEPSSGPRIRHYIVERAPADGTGDFQSIGQTRVPTFRDGGEADSTLRDRTEYLYRVAAVNAVGARGDDSMPVSVVTAPPPAPVSGLEAGSGEVRCVPLVWLPAEDPEVAGYEIYRAEDPEGEFRHVGSVKGRETTSFLAGGRDPGNLADETTYWFRVYAVNRVGARGEMSETVSAVTRPVPPPVERVVADSGLPREVHISWMPSSDEKVVAYEILRARESMTNAFEIVGRVEGRDTSSYLDRGGAGLRAPRGDLEDATLYRYRVVAVNTAGARSKPGDTAAAETIDPPAEPRGVSASILQPRRIEITWLDNKDERIAAYEIERANAEDGPFRALATVPANEDNFIWSYSDEPLDHGAVHYYRIRAVDRYGIPGDWARTVEGRAKQQPPPPEDLAWRTSALTWSIDPRTQVETYRVWRKKFFGWEQIGHARIPRYALSFADVGKSATFAVTAVDEDGIESERSDPVTVRINR